MNCTVDMSALQTLIKRGISQCEAFTDLPDNLGQIASAQSSPSQKTNAHTQEKNSKTVSFQKNDIYRLDPQFEILHRTVAHFVGEDSGHFKSSDVRKCALSLSAQRLLMLSWQTLADTWVIVCGEDPGMLMNNTFFGGVLSELIVSKPMPFYWFANCRGWGKVSAVTMNKWCTADLCISAGEEWPFDLQ